MLSKTNYLDLMGITQWQLRSQQACEVLIPYAAPHQAQWLFILEKQEVMNESPLLQAIVTAIKQTIETVAIAYYEKNSNVTDVFDMSQIRYVVVMGEEPLQQFQASFGVLSEISVITSANLSTLANDTTAKRALWQQLKQYQT